MKLTMARFHPKHGTTLPNDDEMRPHARFVSLFGNNRVS